jgi:membrane-associated phospholipid phosphatase
MNILNFFKFDVIKFHKIVKLSVTVIIFSVLIYEMFIGTAKFLIRARHNSNIKYYHKIYDISSTTINCGLISQTSLRLINISNVSYYARFGFAIGTSATIIFGLKHYINHQRPDNTDNKSFPSGHAGLGFISIIYMIKYLQKKNSMKILCYIFLFFIISILRILAMRHYISDIIGGIWISLIVIIFSETVFKLIFTKYEYYIKLNQK